MPKEKSIKVKKKSYETHNEDNGEPGYHKELIAGDFEYSNDTEGKTLYKNVYENVWIKSGDLRINFERVSDKFEDEHYGISIIHFQKNKSEDFTDKRASKVSQAAVDAFNRAMTDGTLSDKEKKQLDKLTADVCGALKDNKLLEIEAQQLISAAKEISPNTKKTGFRFM